LSLAATRAAENKVQHFCSFVYGFQILILGTRGRGFRFLERKLGKELPLKLFGDVAILSFYTVRILI
jgi:hypothetical protein